MNSKGAREVTPFLWGPKQGGTPAGTAASSRGLERRLELAGVGVSIQGAQGRMPGQLGVVGGIICDREGKAAPGGGSGTSALRHHVSVSAWTVPFVQDTCQGSRGTLILRCLRSHPGLARGSPACCASTLSAGPQQTSRMEGQQPGRDGCPPPCLVGDPWKGFPGLCVKAGIARATWSRGRDDCECCPPTLWKDPAIATPTMPSGKPC